MTTQRIYQKKLLCISYSTAIYKVRRSKSQRTGGKWFT